MDSPPGTAAPSSTNAPSSTPPPAPMAAPSIPNLLARLGNGPPRAGRGGRRGLGRGANRGGGGGLHMGPGSGSAQHQIPYGQQRQHRGGYGGGGGGGGTSRRLDHTSIIQSTDTDAALSRLSAVDIGLLDDPFAHYFAGDGGGPAPRRLPIINRGTYTRTQGLDKIIGAFLSGTPSTETASESSSLLPPPPTPQPRQVVSLGAGTDTRSLRLLAQQQHNGHAAFQNVVYHEIDFPSVCARKRNIVQSAPAIRSLLTSPVTEHTPLDADDTTSSSSTGSSTGSSNTTTHRSWRAELGHGNQLWVHGLDLRKLATGGGDSSSSSVILEGLRTDVPTLLVSECCLCYLQPPEAAAVLRWFTDRIVASPTTTPSLGVVIYEPIRPHDAFGRTMVANLAARGIEMPTLAAYPDGAAQEARLRQAAGLAQAQHRTIDQIWDGWVSEDEQERVNRLDGLDEVEEWQLLASHYVVAWGSQGPHFDTAWAQLYER